MKKNELTRRIYKNIEDGTLALSFKGMDAEEWENITHAEFADYVENCTMWDDIEPEIYESALDDVGLDYHSYDDPDEMWEDYLKAMEN